MATPYTYQNGFNPNQSTAILGSGSTVNKTMTKTESNPEGDSALYSLTGDERYNPDNKITTTHSGVMSGASGSDMASADYFSKIKLKPELSEGEGIGEKLTGFSAAELGSRNRNLSNRIFDELDKPSIGANRLAEQGAARLSQLVASQAQQGVTGGMAQAQRMQLQRQTARDVAGQTQTDYENALNRVIAKQKSDAGSFAGLMGTDAQLGAAMQMESDDGSGGNSYICTELYRQGRVTKKELKKLHRLMFKASILKPYHVYFYLRYGMELLNAMKADKNLCWDSIYTRLVKDTLEGGGIENYIFFGEYLFDGYVPELAEKYTPNKSNKIKEWGYIIYRYFRRAYAI